MNAGRNEPCPCGSGRKYKKCCLAREEASRVLSFFRDDLDWVVNRPRPTLVTSEGDPVEVGTGVFTVKDEQALRRALEEHPAFTEADGIYT